MTKKLLKLTALITMLILTVPTLAQNSPADQILGKWLNEDKDAHVEVYKEGGKYFGKIVWLLNPNDEVTDLPKVDDDNPDVTLQSRPVMGLVILKDFIYDDDGEWEDGTIYDPKNGKTYDCYMEFDEEGVLKIRGYIGFSWIGRSSYWTRVK